MTLGHWIGRIVVTAAALLLLPQWLLAQPAPIMDLPAPPGTSSESAARAPALPEEPPADAPDIAADPAAESRWEDPMVAQGQFETAAPAPVNAAGYAEQPLQLATGSAAPTASLRSTAAIPPPLQGPSAGGERRLAYAKASVIEVGGALALTHDSRTTTFRLTPSAGYFVLDRFELTLFPELRLLRVADGGDGVNDVSVGAALEPSYHALLTPGTFVVGALGVGLRYAKDPGFDGFLRTRLGLDILIGHSGVLKPAAFLDMGFGDGVMAGGLEAGFTIML